MKTHTPTLLNCLLLMVLLSSAEVYAADKIIKWTDASGVTHYDDKPPISEKARQSEVLSKQGVTLRKVDSLRKENIETLKSTVSEEQKRYDFALMNSYSSVKEIELARKRNVEIDELALKDLEKRREKIEARTEANDQSNSIDLSRLQNLELQIEQKQKRINDINESYAKKKSRYKELTSK